MADKTMPWDRKEMVAYSSFRLCYRWWEGRPVDDIRVFMPGGKTRKLSELKERAKLYGVRCMSPSRPRYSHRG